MTKEEEILSAAEEEFFRNGYDACSTANIARRAGVTHAMVNYYFRTKEKLFMQILDNHVYDLLGSLKPLMQADGDVAGVAADAAAVIFDRMNRDRILPFLLSDISRTHPEFLFKYRETLSTTCSQSLVLHRQRLQESIADGQVQECTMGDIYNTVLTLATAPFVAVPLLRNVAGFSEAQIEEYLAARRREMIRIINAGYSI